MFSPVARLLTTLFARKPKTICSRSHPTRLGVEQLGERVVPAVVYTGTFDWNGVATVTVTVDDAVPGYAGQNYWDYHLTNNSLTSGITTFALPTEQSGMVSNLGNSVGWMGSVGTFLNDPDLVAWQAGIEPVGPPGSPPPPLSPPVSALGIGQSADFWFTTAPPALPTPTGLSPTRAGQA